jgi:hypothetical protein
MIHDVDDVEESIHSLTEVQPQYLLRGGPKKTLSRYELRGCRRACREDSTNIMNKISRTHDFQIPALNQTGFTRFDLLNYIKWR